MSRPYCVLILTPEALLNAPRATLPGIQRPLALLLYRAGMPMIGGPLLPDLDLDRFEYLTEYSALDDTYLFGWRPRSNPTQSTP